MKTRPCLKYFVDDCKWWLEDLKKLIFIELTSAKNILCYIAEVNATKCTYFICLKCSKMQCMPFFCKIRVNVMHNFINIHQQSNKKWQKSRNLQWRFVTFPSIKSFIKNNLFQKTTLTIKTLTIKKKKRSELTFLKFVKILKLYILINFLKIFPLLLAKCFIGKILVN